MPALRAIPAPAAVSKVLPSKILAVPQEESCMHISASQLITSHLSEDLFFSDMGCLPDFLGPSFLMFWEGAKLR